MWNNAVFAKLEQLLFRFISKHLHHFLKICFVPNYEYTVEVAECYHFPSLPREFSNNLIQQSDFTQAKLFGRSLLFSLIQKTNSICQRTQPHFCGCYQLEQEEQHISQSQAPPQRFNSNLTLKKKEKCNTLKLLKICKKIQVVWFFFLQNTL